MFLSESISRYARDKVAECLFGLLERLIVNEVIIVLVILDHIVCGVAVHSGAAARAASDEERLCKYSLALPHAYKICRSLSEAGLSVDDCMDEEILAGEIVRKLKDNGERALKIPTVEKPFMLSLYKKRPALREGLF